MTCISDQNLPFVFFHCFWLIAIDNRGNSFIENENRHKNLEAGEASFSFRQIGIKYWF